MYKKWILIFGVSLQLFSMSSNAQLTWFQNVTITSAAYYYDGTNDVWEVTWAEDLSTGCASADSMRKASWAANSQGQRFEIGSSRISPAMAALAAGFKVDLNLNLSWCHATYGAGFEGIRLHKN